MGGAVLGGAILRGSTGSVIIEPPSCEQNVRLVKNITFLQLRLQTIINSFVNQQVTLRYSVVGVGGDKTFTLKHRITFYPPHPWMITF